MLFGKVIAVYCEIHTNSINTICGNTQNMFEVKADNITYSNNFALKNILYTFPNELYNHVVYSTGILSFNKAVYTTLKMYDTAITSFDL
jgi:hypothetical protein